MAQPERLKNIHIEVPEPFHQKLKLLCVIKKTTLRAYGLKAIEEKVARDDALLAQKP